MSAYLELARRGRNAWWCYLATPVLALVLWAVLIAVSFAAAFIAHVMPPDFTEQATDPAHPEYFYSFTGGIFAALLLAFVLAIRLVHGKRFVDIVGAWKWRQMAAGVGLWLILCVVSSLVDYLIKPAGFRFTLGSQTLTLALFAIPGLAAQTFCEEFVFRGYVTQGLFLAIKRPAPAAVISGLVFASLHIPNGWPEAASALVFGVVTALIVMRTGNLAFTYGLHLTNNLFGAIVVVSSSDVLHGSPGVVTQTTPELMWLDVVTALVAFAAAWWLVTRRGWTLAPAPEEAF